MPRKLITGASCCAAGRIASTAGLKARLNRVIEGSAASAALSSDGASWSSLTAGPERAISSVRAGVSSGATGRRASSEGFAIPSVVLSVPSVVCSAVRNGGSELTVAVSAVLRAAVADSTCSPARDEALQIG